MLQTLEDQLEYLPAYQILLCTTHATALQNVDVHLHKHHAMPKAQRRLVLTWLGDRGWIPIEPALVTLPPPGSAPIDALGPPLPGYACMVGESCQDNFLTASWNALQRHLNKAHQLSSVGDPQERYRKVYLQTFYRLQPYLRYFTMQPPSQLPAPSTPLGQAQGLMAR